MIPHGRGRASVDEALACRAADDGTDAGFRRLRDVDGLARQYTDRLAEDLRVRAEELEPLEHEARLR